MMRMEELIQKRFNELTERAKSSVVVRGHGGEPEVNNERFHEWATSALNLLQRTFGEDSAHYHNFREHYESFNGFVHEFEPCRGIFQAAREDYEGGFLFNIRALIKAEVLADDVLGQARELLNAGYKDPACVLVGVALETTLKEMCTRASVPQNKTDRMNADLCKAGIYNLAKQKQITAWVELRNKAAHGNWGEYTLPDVEDFLNGVERFIGDYL